MKIRKYRKLPSCEWKRLLTFVPKLLSIFSNSIHWREHRPVESILENSFLFSRDKPWQTRNRFVVHSKAELISNFMNRDESLPSNETIPRNSLAWSLYFQIKAIHESNETSIHTHRVKRDDWAEIFTVLNRVSGYHKPRCHRFWTISFGIIGNEWLWIFRIAHLRPTVSGFHAPAQNHSFPCYSSPDFISSRAALGKFLFA